MVSINIVPYMSQVIQGQVGACRARRRRRRRGTLLPVCDKIDTQPGIGIKAARPREPPLCAASRPPEYTSAPNLHFIPLYKYLQWL